MDGFEELDGILSSVSKHVAAIPSAGAKRPNTKRGQPRKRHRDRRYDMCSPGRICIVVVIADVFGRWFTYSCSGVCIAGAGKQFSVTRRC